MPDGPTSPGAPLSLAVGRIPTASSGLNEAIDALDNKIDGQLASSGLYARVRIFLPLPPCLVSCANVRFSGAGSGCGDLALGPLHPPKIAAWLDNALRQGHEAGRSKRRQDLKAMAASPLDLAGENSPTCTRWSPQPR